MCGEWFGLFSNPRIASNYPKHIVRVYGFGMSVGDPIDYAQPASTTAGAVAGAGSSAGSGSGSGPAAVAAVATTAATAAGGGAGLTLAASGARMTYGIVMKRYNMTLSALLSRKNPTYVDSYLSTNKQKMNVVRDLCTGIAFIHNLDRKVSSSRPSIIHGDIKLGNILVDGIPTSPPSASAPALVSSNAAIRICYCDFNSSIDVTRRENAGAGADGDSRASVVAPPEPQECFGTEPCNMNKWFKTSSCDSRRLVTAGVQYWHDYFALGFVVIDVLRGRCYYPPAHMRADVNQSIYESFKQYLINEKDESKHTMIDWFIEHPFHLYVGHKDVDTEFEQRNLQFVQSIKQPDSDFFSRMKRLLQLLTAAPPVSRQLMNERLKGIDKETTDTY
jgi:serine/threonine protein kinase